MIDSGFDNVFVEMERLSSAMERLPLQRKGHDRSVFKTDLDPGHHVVW